MVSIKNLKKSFGQSVILDNVNLEIGKGEALVMKRLTSMERYIRAVEQLENRLRT